MKSKEAIAKRLLDYCKERNITPNKLATISCLTQSTINNIISLNNKDCKILTIIRICDGLGISLKEFFDDPIFDNLDRED